MHRSDTAELVQLTLGDFRILHSELQFGGTLVDTETGGIHTGRWRLDVISTFSTSTPHAQVARRGRHTQLQTQGRRGGMCRSGVSSVACEDSLWRQVRAWLATVRSLAHIRHENVLLYMGAAVDPPRFAIVTCPVKVTRISGDITLQ